MEMSAASCFGIDVCTDWHARLFAPVAAESSIHIEWRSQSGLKTMTEGGKALQTRAIEE
jgi:hypothetical protein